MNSTIPADLLELEARFETWRTNRKYVNFRQQCMIVPENHALCRKLTTNIYASLT
jgi:hypothetical protein